jgi:hypothetical protein
MGLADIMKESNDKTLYGLTRSLNTGNNLDLAYAALNENAGHT